MLTAQKFELRDYQQKVIQKVNKLIAYGCGVKSILVYAPTGSGKTCIAASIMAEAVSHGHRVLFLVHRDELIDQTLTELDVYGLKAGIIKGNIPENRNLQVQIASLQTLQYRQPPDNIKLVVIDESHTTAYWQSFAAIKKFYSPCSIPSLGRVIYIGLTATPWRTEKNQYNGQHFDAIVSAPKINQLVSEGHLAKPEHLGWGGVADMSKLELDRESNEFTMSSMIAAVSHPDFNRNVIEKFQFKCQDRDRTAIAFCVSVKQSEKLCGDFNSAGIKSAHIDGNTPIPERKYIFEQLRIGQIRVLCSVNTLTEGFNVKTIEAVIIARPTNSVTLLLQMSGRGLRISPETDKNDCLLLDFCENFARLGRVTDSRNVELCLFTPTTGKKKQFKPRSLTKECPNCGSIIAASFPVCPQCSYEYPGMGLCDDLPPVEGKNLPPFGELLTPKERRLAENFRDELRECFRLHKSPSRAEDEFQKVYGYFPPKNWHVGALFQGNLTEQARIRYVTYLRFIKPKASDEWKKERLRTEFGDGILEEDKTCDDEIEGAADLPLQKGIKDADIFEMVGLPESCTRQELDDKTKQAVENAKKKGDIKRANKLAVAKFYANQFFE